MGRSAAFFDLDKTVIARSSVMAFGRSFYEGGLITRRDLIRNAYAQLAYMRNGADDVQMARIRDAFAATITGWDVAQVRSIVAAALHQLIEPMIYAEAAVLIAEHQAAGRDVVIVSTSGEEVVQPIGELLGVDRAIATRMVIADGRYTGAVEFYAAGPTKATAIRELAASAGYDLADCYGYSDSISDIPMLSAVGHPYAVNPDRALRKAAADRDWPVLEFKRPVRLTRLRRPSNPALATVVVATAIGTAAGLGAFWYVRHRRGRES